MLPNHFIYFKLNKENAVETEITESIKISNCHNFDVTGLYFH